MKTKINTVFNPLDKGYTILAELPPEVADYWLARIGSSLRNDWAIPAYCNKNAEDLNTHTLEVWLYRHDLKYYLIKKR